MSCDFRREWRELIIILSTSNFITCKQITRTYFRQEHFLAIHKGLICKQSPFCSCFARCFWLPLLFRTRTNVRCLQFSLLVHIGNLVCLKNNGTISNSITFDKHKTGFTFYIVSPPHHHISFSGSFPLHQTAFPISQQTCNSTTITTTTLLL